MYTAGHEYPSDTTVFINQTAAFTCVIHGAPLHQYWRVNGTPFGDLPSDIRDNMKTTQMTVGGDEKFTLIILGKAEYNETRVQCVVEDEGGQKESENSTLSIQGIHNIINATWNEH